MKRTHSAAVCLFFPASQKKLGRGGLVFSSGAPWAKLFLRGRTKTSKRLQSECYLYLPLRANLKFETLSAQAFLRSRQKQANGCRVSAFHFLAAVAGGEAKEAWRLDGECARFKNVVFLQCPQKKPLPQKKPGGPLKPSWPSPGGLAGLQVFFWGRFFFGGGRLLEIMFFL